MNRSLILFVNTCLLMLITHCVMGQALQGTYTIGATASDYPGFTSAIAALKTNGISNKVIFKVRAGTYAERIVITTFAGSSCSNTVTFESENGDSSSVVLVSPNAVANYVVQLNGADGIIFRKMTIRSTTGVVVDIRGGSDCNQFLNNRLTGIKSTSSSEGYSIIYSTNDQFSNNKNIIQNNLFEDGSYGIRFTGNSSAHSNGLTIEGNILKGQNYTGIGLTYNDSVRIAGNEITSESTSYISYGILLQNSQKGFQIIKNKIVLFNNGYYNMYGISPYEADGTTASKGLIANNFIRVNGPTDNYGIYEVNADYVQIFDNNVSVSAAGTYKGYSMYYYSGSNLEVKNNIFANVDGGYAVYAPYTVSSFQSDYNNYYTSGAVLGYWGDNRADLTAWKTASTQDSHSLSINPLFKSATDLHVTQTDLNGKGVTLSQITDDIDGEPRNATTPDIGADEFTPATSDAGITLLNAPVIPFLHGNQTVKATLKNYGSQSLVSAVIHWQVNGQEQTPYTFSGALASGATTILSIGTFNFSLGTAYSFTTWAALPNGVADTQPANDTTKISNVYAGMSGSYTIGGTTPTFATFVAAADALNKGGIVGSVNFKVRSGTYAGPISLSAFPGTSCSNTVTFESESGDSTLVILSAANSTSNYTVQLNGADGIIFSKMTIRSTTGVAVDIRGGSDCNQFLNNQLTGIKTGSTSETYSVVYSPFDQLPNNKNIFRNNRIDGGSYAIRFLGYSTIHSSGWVIENNLLRGQNYAGIYLTYNDSVRIAGNDIASESASYMSYGIQLQSSVKGFQIIRNKIVLSNNGYYTLYGINPYGADGTNTSKGMIINNFVRVNGSSDSYGIYEVDGDYLQILHNNVSVTAAANYKGYALYYYSGSNLDIRNNIFTNFATGYAVYAYYLPTTLVSDHNDYYTSGSTLGYWNDNRADLAAWKTATSQDAHSLSINPFFKSTTDLHVTQIDLNGKAIPITQVTDDIDGEPRNANNPDIGADEFTPAANDAGITLLNAPVIPFLHGNQTVQVTLKNYGTQSLTAATIHWQINGQEQTPYSFSGALVSGSSVVLSIGTFSFNLGTAFGFTLWSSLPNGAADVQPANDTAKVTGVYAGMSGSYTIGGATPTFATVVAAADALNNGGILGSVNFKVRAGTYTGQFSLGAFPGTSCSNTVTFESENGDSTSVIITSPSTTNNYTVQLNGADGIIFKKLSIRSTGGVVVDIRGGSDCNQFLNNQLTGIKTSNYQETYAVVYSPNDQASNNRNMFRNNQFDGGSYGIYFYGYSAIHSTGSVVENNIFKGQSYTGLSFQYNDSLKIIANSITIDSSTYDSYGIRLQYIQKGFQISKNKIVLSKADYGIYMYDADGTATNKAIVVNNFVRVNGVSNNYGIYEWTGDYVQIFNNNVSVNTTNTTRGNVIYYYAGSNVEIKNNVFANTNGGFAVYTDYIPTNLQSDYNDYYTQGSTLGYYNGNRADLTAWKLATSLDAHSLSVNPLFRSATDLHISQTDLRGKGTPLTQVTDDIDGDPRNTTPDIGADEFTSAASDAGISLLNAPVVPFMHGNQTVKATLKNYGAQPLTSVVIHWQVNGQEQTPYNYTGTIATGATTVVDIGSYNFALGTGYNFTLWTNAPNGVADLQPANDTARVANIYAGMNGSYTIGGTAPTFATVVAAADALNKGGILGNVNFKVRSGTYAGQFSLGAFPGTGCSKTVTFESESGDTASVIVTGAGSDYNNNNYAVQLNGADGITFSKLTIKAGSGIALDIRGGSNCNQVLNSHLIGIKNSTALDGLSVIYTYNDQNTDNNNIFLNNQLDDGSYGMRFAGSSVTHSSGLDIENNVFKGQTYMGIYASYNDSVKIAGNQILSDNSLYGFYGINLEYCQKGFQITKNKIVLATGAYGIRMYDADGTATSKATIINNFIRVSNTSDGYGIYEWYGDNVQIYNNNVSVSAGGTNKGYSIQYYSSSNLDVKNNIFANPGGGYAVYSYSNTANLQSDYNDYYTTGTVLGYLNGDRADLAAWKTNSGLDVHSLSINPLFKSATDLHITQVGLDGKATPLTQVTDDIDGEPRDATTPDIGADEFNNNIIARNIAVDSLVQPVTSCGLNNATIVKIKITNAGAQTETGFTVAYIMNNGTPVVENVDTLSIRAGQSAYYSFKTPAPFSKAGIYNFTVYVSLAQDQNRLNDTLKNVLVQNIGVVQPVALTLPAANATSLPITVINFSWSADSSATFYDLYLWKSTDSVPANASRSNLTSLSYIYNSGLLYNTTYNWKIVARNSCSSSSSPVRSFSTISIPDLRVDTVTVPVEGFAGQNIPVSWRVTNIGKASTGATAWTDRVFLSTDKFYDAPELSYGDKLLGEFSNPSALNADSFYIQNQTVKLPIPPDVQDGNYYIIVVTDYTGQLAEGNENNNYGASVVPVKISTSYPADLVVDSIIVPSTGFAARSIKVNWKIKNAGGRATTVSQWTDRIYVSANPVFSPGSALVQYAFIHNGALAQNDSYFQSQNILIPENISGTYYIHVFTDAGKQVPEGNLGGEDNNTAISNSFAVNLKMPADLLVTQLTVPLQASVGQKANIKWTVKNQGDTAIQTANWNDKIYLSTLPAFDINNATLAGSYYHSGGLAANTEYSNSVLVNIPLLSKGNYFVYVVTDADLNAAEFDESNNTRKSDAAVQLGVPDLQVKNVAISGSVNPGQTLKVIWNIQNAGDGALETASWTDRIFLSPNDVYTPGNAIWFDVKFASQTLAAGASVSREIDLKIPDIVSGKYYAYVYTDFANFVFEDAFESNNVSRSSATSNITTGLPVNDIGVSEIINPKSDCGLSAGETITVKITNYGNLPHTGFNVGYRINAGSVVTEDVGALTLLPASSLEYSFSTRVNFSSTGSYSLKAFTTLASDMTSSNDTTSATIQHFFLLDAPANLLPQDGTVNLSKPVNFSWSAVPNATKYDLFIWKSSDTMPSLPVAAGLSQINFSYADNVLQYGASFKWMVRATSNHCQALSAIQTFIVRSLPDLVIDSVILPEHGGTSETNFSVSWITKNQGSGSTGAIRWYESLYLAESIANRSTDRLIANFDNVSALDAGQSYTHPVYTFTIPPRYLGTYYLVLKTNIYNSVNEVTDTNDVRIIPIDITLLPPPDLQVDSIVVSPTTVFSEDTLNVSWSVYNRGPGSTTGSNWQDYVYLSTSQTLNLSTATRLGVFTHNGSLASNDHYTRNEKVKIPAHLGGTYFIHIVTDATDYVYEFLHENNNIGTWSNLHIVMRPNPNLTISSITVPTDSISNGQSINVQWISKNDGAAAASPIWYDHLRLTTDTSNGYGNYINQGYILHADIIQSLSSGETGKIFLSLQTCRKESIFLCRIRYL